MTLTDALRLIFWLLVGALLTAFLSYTLPQKDVVRVVQTDIRRVDVGDRPLFWAEPDSGQAALETRDVRFIRAEYPDGGTMEFRNEDTGLGWPPYFKFDSDELQTQAAVAAREGEWVVIRHYGWRNNLLSIYPNAVSMRPAEGPDERAFSWTSIVILVLLAMLIWALASRWRRFKRRRISPALDRWDAAWDERMARYRSRRGGS